MQEKPWKQLIRRTPEEAREVVGDSLLVALIILAAVAVEALVQWLEHFEWGRELFESGVIVWILQLSLWFLAAVYTIKVGWSLLVLLRHKRSEWLGNPAEVGGSEPTDSGQRRGPVAGERLSVLVVDDDCMVGQSISGILELDPRIEATSFCDSLDGALEMLGRREANAPDVILLDVEFRGDRRTGVDMIDKFRASSPDSRVLVMSISRDAKTVRSALDHRADGFLWKNETNADIAEAVVAAARNTFVVSKSIALSWADGGPNPRTAIDASPGE